MIRLYTITFNNRGSCKILIAFTSIPKSISMRRFAEQLEDIGLFESRCAFKNCLFTYAPLTPIQTNFEATLSILPQTPQKYYA